MMKFKQVMRFAKRVNYGNKVNIFPGYEILQFISTDEEFCERFDDDELWCAAVPITDKENGDVIDFIVCIGREFHKEHKNRTDMYKFVLLHEIGHIHTYHDSVFNSEYEEAVWELDAQLWALRRAKEMGLKRVAKKVWENFQKWGEMDNPYKKAKEIYDKK